MQWRKWTRASLTLGVMATVMASRSTAQEPVRPWQADAALQRTLESLAKDFRGDVGLYVHHLRSGRGAAIRADEVFPTASMIKVPILATYHDRIAAGEMSPKTMLVRGDSAIYNYPDDVGEIGNLKGDAKVQMAVVAFLMITTSDNSAAIWMQALVGGGTVVNDWLARNGFDSTRVNSRTPGREAARSTYGWGQTTPREMARLLTRVRQREVVSAAASEEMYRTLSGSYWNGESLSQLPPWVQAASKQGAVDKSRSEVLLVNAPSGDYVVCVITKNQTDERYEPDNAGYELLRQVSAAVWRHFEPKHPYTPAEGAALLKP